MNKLKPDKDITRRLLDELTRESIITQRTLSSRLDVALGLVNAYIKRLARKGYIKVTTIPKNRVKYILTPKGFAEKVRLTYEYMHYSIDYFKDVRQKIDGIYKYMINSGVKSVLFWGDGEIAELCYISMRGTPLTLIGVINGNGVEKGFFGYNVYTVEALKDLSYDAILITSLYEKEMQRIKAIGFDGKKVYSL